MSPRYDDTILVGPIVQAPVEGFWCFMLVTGLDGCDDDSAGADEVNATSPALLETVRAALLLTFRAAAWVKTIETFGDEMALARGAAARWPRKFASLVAMGEVLEAGGGRA